MISSITPVNFGKYERKIKKIPAIQEEKDITFKTDVIYPVNKNCNLSELQKGQMSYGNIIYNRSTTDFCRSDVDWRDLGEYLKEKYGSLDNVDFHCFACSTGEEAYTLSLLLQRIFPDENVKIKASDIVSSRIDYAKERQQKSNGIPFAIRDINLIYASLGLKKDEFEKFFETVKPDTFSLKKEIVNSVEFFTKNILESVDDFNSSKPSFIMARNMWPYVDPELYQEFANELYEKLPSGSAIMLGGFDCDGEYGHKNSDCFPAALVVAGFKPVDRAIGSVCKLRNKERILIYEKN